MGCRTLIVSKPLPAKFRLTFDFRPVNACTEPMAWPMPHMDSVCAQFAGSNVIASLYFCSGYWKVPLGKEGQEAHSFMTSDGTYSSVRTLQGGRNSGPNFQSGVEPLFERIKENVQAYTDTLPKLDCYRF